METLGSLERYVSPKNEGGLGFRLLTSSQKHWLKNYDGLLERISSWSSFMWNKYCKKHHLLMAKGTWASHACRKIFEIWKEVEHEIWWQLKAREMKDRIMGEEEIEVKQLTVNGEWDIQSIRGLISKKMTEYIVKNIRTNIEEEAFDIPWWMGNSGEVFTVGSFIESIKQKKDKHW
ncbi:hypothetical protein H5410_027023 [Solanum commersonii]|uniref:Uncharacterized protein n=1 Tax=Solanum commersonii TaxID=4109 RepID=A0A9J5YXV1_SOLCO|nr:hypothetical protein H5410_027023 [Solanum commersonii]